MSKALNEIKKFRKKILIELYSQCTEPQKGKFNLLFKNIDSIPDNKIDSAILICERTILKNKKDN